MCGFNALVTLVLSSRGIPPQQSNHLLALCLYPTLIAWPLIIYKNKKVPVQRGACPLHQQFHQKRLSITMIARSITSVGVAFAVPAATAPSKPSGGASSGGTADMGIRRISAGKGQRVIVDRCAVLRGVLVPRGIGLGFGVF